ncbi:MAG TPA: hypothetical protein VGK25_11845 [Ignavibacteria bacterium]|jgi:hypothetical protein
MVLYIKDIFVTKSVHKKLLFVIIYIIIITLFDAYSFGIIYQQKIQQENYQHPVWSWVFWESGKESGAEHVEVPRYRLIQKALEISGILVVLFYCGFPAALGLVISHYLLTYDFLFYLFLNELNNLKNFDNTFIPYWLMNWYQVGYFLLKPFNHLNFYLSGAAGLVIAIGSCFVNEKVK